MPHQNVDIPLTVTERRLETPDHLTLVFQRPPRFEFEAGDWIDLEIPGLRSRWWPDVLVVLLPRRSPSRDHVKVEQSGFKRALQEAKPGDTMHMTAYGNGVRLLAAPAPVKRLLIAAGVGVAPFRSMIAEMAETDSGESAHLIYLNRTDDFFFEGERPLEQAAPRAADRLRRDGWHEEQGTPSDPRRQRQDPAVHYYYIAGPPAMMATEAVLMEAGAEPTTTSASTRSTATEPRCGPSQCDPDQLADQLVRTAAYGTQARTGSPVRASCCSPRCAGSVHELVLLAARDLRLRGVSPVWGRGMPHPPPQLISAAALVDDQW